MRIRQVHVSSSISFFARNFRRKFGLEPFRDPYQPTVVFGCYNPTDIDMIMRHRSLVVLIWGGSDAMRLPRPRFRPVSTAGHVRHVSISKFISADLMRLNVPHIFLPVCPTRHDIFEPVPLGKCVYSYYNPRFRESYGFSLLRQLEARLPDLEFIYAHMHSRDNAHSYKEMPAVYSKCFIGLRLTPHDGLPNTVVEMGLMGRRCVHNGWIPNSIPWRGVEDIERTIREESQRPRQCYPKLAEQVKDFLALPENWLHTEFYEGPVQ